MGAIRAVLSSLVLLMCLVSFALWYDHSLFTEYNEELSYALEVATYDATLTLMESRTSQSMNRYFDGSQMDDFSVKHEIAYDEILETFNTSFDSNVRNGVQYEIPVVGVATYDRLFFYIKNVGWSNGVLYTYFDPDTNLSYAFTLGEKFEIHDYNSDITTNHTLSTYTGTVEDMTIAQMKDYTIMKTYNDWLSWALNSESNLVARNTNVGVRIHFPTAEVAESGGKKVYISDQNIIHSPGVFGVVDQIYSGSNVKHRLIDFGGAELELK